MSLDDDANDNDTKSVRMSEQMRLLMAAMRHIRQAQMAASRVNVLTTATPGIAREQAIEAGDQAGQALKCLEALKNLLKKSP